MNDLWQFPTIHADEYDYDEEDDIKEISSTEYEVDGSARLDEISETFGLKLESDDYDSIAGHIICKLGHLPTVGESVTEENVITQDHSDGVVADEFFADNEGLSQSIGAGLLGIA